MLLEVVLVADAQGTVSGRGIARACGAQHREAGGGTLMSCASRYCDNPSLVLGRVMRDCSKMCCRAGTIAFLNRASSVNGAMSATGRADQPLEDHRMLIEV